MTKLTEAQLLDWYEVSKTEIIQERDILRAGAKQWNAVYKVVLDERDALRVRVKELEEALMDAHKLVHDLVVIKRGPDNDTV